MRFKRDRRKTMFPNDSTQGVNLLVSLLSHFLQNKTLKASLGVSTGLRVEASGGGAWGGHMGWCLLRWRSAGGSVGGDLRDLRLGRLVGGLDEHGLGQLLAGRHRHLLDLVELLQHTHTASRGLTSVTHGGGRMKTRQEAVRLTGGWLPVRQ